jgi:hypothetical protein
MKILDSIILNYVDKITEDLPPKIANDERIKIIFEAITVFFDAKKVRKKELNISDDDINKMKSKILKWEIYERKSWSIKDETERSLIFIRSTRICNPIQNFFVLY